jgi:hypothetical protein
MDDITPLQQLANDKVMTEDVHLFDVRPSVLLANDIMLSRQMGGAKHFQGQNPPRGTAISYHLKGPVAGDVKIAISDITGKVLRDLPGTNVAGINRVPWPLTANPPQLPPGAGRGFGGGGGRGGFNQGPPVEPGTYLVKLSAGGKDYTTKVVVEADDMGR